MTRKQHAQMALLAQGYTINDAILATSHLDSDGKERQRVEGAAWRPTEDELMEHVLEEERICGRSR